MIDRCPFLLAWLVLGAASWALIAGLAGLGYSVWLLA